MSSELDFERARFNDGVFLNNVRIDPHSVGIAEALDGVGCEAELRLMIGSAVLRRELDVVGVACDDLAAFVHEDLLKHGTLAASGYLQIVRADGASTARSLFERFRQQQPVAIAWEWARVDAVAEEHETIIVTGGARKARS